MINFVPEKFVDYIRRQKCVVCFNSPCDPDHLSQIGMGRNRRDPMLLEHLSCVPLCREHHIERHRIGLVTFEKNNKVNLWRENHEYLISFIQEEEK